MWQEYLTPYTIEEALSILAMRSDNARLVAGGTDLTKIIFYHKISFSLPKIYL